MPIKTKQKNTTNNKPSSLKEKLTKMRYLNLVAFVVVFSMFAASVIFYTSAAPKNRIYITVPTIYLSPSSQRLSSKSNLIISLYEDSLSQPVNAVQANLIYDSSVFDVVKIDGASSAFEIEAQASGSNGSINIARGHVGSLTGKQLIAYVTLRPKSGATKTSVNFTAGTLLISSTTNTDILQSMMGGNYTIR